MAAVLWIVSESIVKHFQCGSLAELLGSKNRSDDIITDCHDIVHPRKFSEKSHNFKLKDLYRNTIPNWEWIKNSWKSQQIPEKFYENSEKLQTHLTMMSMRSIPSASINIFLLFSSCIHEHNTSNKFSTTSSSDSPFGLFFLNCCVNLSHYNCIYNDFFILFLYLTRFYFWRYRKLILKKIKKINRICLEIL